MELLNVTQTNLSDGPGSESLSNVDSSSGGNVNGGFSSVLESSINKSAENTPTTDAGSESVTNPNVSLTVSMMMSGQVQSMLQNFVDAHTHDSEESADALISLSSEDEAQLASWIQQLNLSLSQWAQDPSTNEQDWPAVSEAVGEINQNILGKLNRGAQNQNQFHLNMPEKSDLVSDMQSADSHSGDMLKLNALVNSNTEHALANNDSQEDSGNLGENKGLEFDDRFADANLSRGEFFQNLRAMGGTNLDWNQSLSTIPPDSHQLTIEIPVSQAEFGDAVTDRVLWLSNQNLKSAAMQLNPPDLGPLEVQVKITNDQASVMFNSQHAVVRDALEGSFGRLRDQLSGQGFNLVEISFAQQGFNQNQSADQSRTRQGYGFEGNADSEEVPMISRVSGGRIMNASGIDLYA